MFSNISDIFYIYLTGRCFRVLIWPILDSYAKTCLSVFETPGCLNDFAVNPWDLVSIVQIFNRLLSTLCTPHYLSTQQAFVIKHYWLWVVSV